MSLLSKKTFKDKNSNVWNIIWKKHFFVTSNCQKIKILKLWRTSQNLHRFFFLQVSSIAKKINLSAKWNYTDYTYDDYPWYDDDRVLCQKQKHIPVLTTAVHCLILWIWLCCQRCPGNISWAVLIIKYDLQISTITSTSSVL